MTADSRLTMLLSPRDIEPEAWAQIWAALDHPWLSRMAIMPDIHAGYDLPIGTVALTDGVISPSFVGYDIGCGMCLSKTGLGVEELGLDSDDRRRELVKIIKAAVPMGLGGQRDSDHPQAPPFRSALDCRELDQKVNAASRRQLGTLGGGNHFIEIGLSRHGTVCVTIHSGSRKAGHLLCEYYLGLCGTFSQDPRAERSYLRLDCELGQAYLQDMTWALAFALENRRQMMTMVLEALGVTGASLHGALFTMINENHNHAEVKEGGQVLHRKGATPADHGQLGVIPGSMATGVYITVGLGNQKYLSSASHGAGRAMSRGHARRSISMADFQASMNGITADISPDLLDEAPQAYKDIAWVIDRQWGVVVDPVDHVAPLINIKGV